ncbi:hypothetical protein SISSUDRAFT_1118558 [Sistotremastrum suecicum HHB10207 ss-3]|uniref:Tudor domain-containing protein n=1 Tax=Sistotremastrum suecicum HHB10207 ss-3 TaxID=1314776 RepID=A0A166EZU0_9AGAM|nr:hypothetical protein SISSUDRAFT_1118558 [Sistotremastrum suecicum HHB10207 ss-3]
MASSGGDIVGPDYSHIHKNDSLKENGQSDPQTTGPVVHRSARRKIPSRPPAHPTLGTTILAFDSSEGSDIAPDTAASPSPSPSSSSSLPPALSEKESFAIEADCAHQDRTSMGRTRQLNIPVSESVSASMNTQDVEAFVEQSSAFNAPLSFSGRAVGYPTSLYESSAERLTHSRSGRSSEADDERQEEEPEFEEDLPLPTPGQYRQQSGVFAWKTPSSPSESQDRSVSSSLPHSQRPEFQRRRQNQLGADGEPTQLDEPFSDMEPTQLDDPGEPTQLDNPGEPTQLDNPGEPTQLDGPGMESDASQHGTHLSNRSTEPELGVSNDIALVPPVARKVVTTGIPLSSHVMQRYRKDFDLVVEPPKATTDIHAGGPANAAPPDQATQLDEDVDEAPRPPLGDPSGSGPRSPDDRGPRHMANVVLTSEPDALMSPFALVSKAKSTTKSAGQTPYTPERSRRLPPLQDEVVEGREATPELEQSQDIPLISLSKGKQVERNTPRPNQAHVTKPPSKSTGKRKRTREVTSPIDESTHDHSPNPVTPIRKKTNDTRQPRSAKRLRTHSPGLAEKESLANDGTRVFAFWKSDGFYYSGTVTGPYHSSSSKYSVLFDDSNSADVDISQLRQCILHVHDLVQLCGRAGRGVGKVVSTSRWLTEGIVTVQMDSDDSELDLAASELKLRKEWILADSWQNRLIQSDAIIFPTHTPGPSANLRRGGHPPPSSKGGGVLSRVGFLITLCPNVNDADSNKDRLCAVIKAAGGTFITDWNEIFSLDDALLTNGKYWMRKIDDIKYIGKGLDRIFLLSDQESHTAKYLIALALGVPCLSISILDEVKAKGTFNWKNHVLAAGASRFFGQKVAQRFAYDWGDNLDLSQLFKFSVSNKAFIGEKVLCLGPSFVPKNIKKGLKNAKVHEASSSVPVIISAMGALHVEATVDAKLASLSLQEYDHIILPDGAKSKGMDTKYIYLSAVKDCLISCIDLDKVLDFI